MQVLMLEGFGSVTNVTQYRLDFEVQQVQGEESWTLPKVISLLG